MSLLSRDEIRITLGPERVWLERMRGGIRRGAVTTHAVPCDIPASDEMPWAKSLESLAWGLRKLEGAKVDATVVLSNHFVRYALVPWSEQISGQDEEQAFIRHCFTQTYGEHAQGWAFRMSPGGYGEMQVASAIDQGLLDGLERVAATHGLRLVSLQPHFMTAFNQWRHRLLDPAPWFVVAEPGRLCVSQLQQGHWSSLRTVKVGEDWQQALRKLLERELLVSESGLERGIVYFSGPELVSAAALPGWRVYQLQVPEDSVPHSRIDLTLNQDEE